MSELSRAGRDLGGPSARPNTIPWVLVAGGFHAKGGMDRANAELAHYLCSQDVPVHLVGFRISDEFAQYSNAYLHKVPVTAGSVFLSGWRLARLGRQVAEKVRALYPTARLLANGGNCALSDINWVHCVHQSWGCNDATAPLWFRAKNRITKFIERRNEKKALSGARLILANCERTKRDIVETVRAPLERVRTVYLGSDDRWKTATPERRAASRSWLGASLTRPLVAFVGALGYDNNKGFDTLWKAWHTLCARSDWNVDLVVAGSGRGLPRWRKTVIDSGYESRVRFLGFTDRVFDLLTAADLLVSPVRYESYGLNVQEALVCGLPAIVTATAGIAERYPVEMKDLLLPDPNDARDLVHRLLQWHAHSDEFKKRIIPLATMLRKWTWRDMAEQIIAEVQERELSGTK